MFAVLALGGAGWRRARDTGGKAAAGRIVVVIRSGALGTEEVSPRSKGAAPNLWRLALTGFTATAIEPPEGLPPAAGLADLAAAVLPPPLLRELAEWGARERPRRCVALDFDDGAAAALLLDGGAVIPALGQLAAARRRPPDAAPAARAWDTGALRAILRAAGGLPAPPEAAGAVSGDLAAALRGADLTLARFVAAPGTEADAARRDALLGRLVEAAGAEAHVFVVNLPAAGPGSLLASGPRCKHGRVLAERRTLRLLRDALAVQIGYPLEEEASVDLFRP